jgi:hypothetical protein
MIWLLAWPSAAVWAQIDSSAQFPIPPHQSRYEVLRNGKKIGEVTTRLSRDERGIWFFDTDTIATSTLARMLRLSAEESAHFMWQDGQILPLTYRNVAREPLRTRFWQHQLDWNAGISRAQTHEGDLEIELEAGLLDPLTLRLQTSAALALSKGIDGGRLEARVIERDDIEDQRMEWLGEERLTTDLGCFETQRWYRFRREGSSRNYRMWLSKDLHWMPLRIDLGDEDNAIGLRLIETDLLAAPATCD